MCTCNLRPHHALCTRFFTGHGYSPDFTRNMERVLGLLREGARVRIAAGADDLCAACPNLVGGACVCSGKVDRYDAAVSELCGLEPGQVIEYAHLRELVRERILAPGCLGEVCADCEWRELCDAALRAERGI